MLNAESIKDDLAKGLERYKNLGLDLYFKASLNEKASLKLVYKDYQVEVFSEEFIEPSQKIAIDESSIRENLDRFKDEIFKAESINIEIDDNIFIRKKTINKLRRDAIRALSDKIGGAYKRKEIEIKKPSLKRFQIKNQK